MIGIVNVLPGALDFIPTKHRAQPTTKAFAEIRERRQLAKPRASDQQVTVMSINKI